MSSLHVLMYHEILPQTTWAPGVPGPIRTAQGLEEVLPLPLYQWEEDFSDQMQFLLTEGFHVAHPAEVLEAYRSGASLPDRSVLVTLDDLWKGGMNCAYPVLKRLGLPALAFLVRGWVFDEAQELVPGRPVCLSWAEKLAFGDVFLYANHTDQLHTRGPAGPALLTVSDQELAADLDRCEEKTTLKGVFAYPYGAVGPRTPEVLRRQGFSVAFTTEPGPNDRGTDPFRLRRNLVPFGIGLDAFAKILES